MNLVPSYANNVVPLTLKLPLRRAFPFPVDVIPETLHTNAYFVEKFQHLEFLRSAHNPFFIRELCSANVSFEMMTGRTNAFTSQQETGQFELLLFWAQFLPNARSLGYEFQEETVWFVPVVESTIDWPDLGEPMTTFYGSARLEKCEVADEIAALSFATSGMSNLIAAVATPYLQPYER